ncbi:MAG: DoxX family protein [Pirellulales bacterium]|nr:DoxX family protein [Pirellulales bacterium]
MNPQNIWLKRTGLALHVLIAALFVFAGGFKLVGTIPPEQLETMGALKDKVSLLGIGELATAILILIPWTAPLGTLMMSGLWGGIIAYNMSQGQFWAPWAVLLVVTWIGAYLRGTVPLLTLPAGTTLAVRD